MASGCTQGGTDKHNQSIKRAGLSALPVAVSAMLPFLHAVNITGSNFTENVSASAGGAVNAMHNANVAVWQSLFESNTAFPLLVTNSTGPVLWQGGAISMSGKVTCKFNYLLGLYQVHSCHTSSMGRHALAAGRSAHILPPHPSNGAHA